MSQVMIFYILNKFQLCKIILTIISVTTPPLYMYIVLANYEKKFKICNQL